MKLSFSTLGCPQWELERVVGAAREYGFEGIELRALGGSLDLLDRPEFQPQAIEDTGRLLREAGVEVVCVDTSCSFHSPSRAERTEQIEIALRHCELALALGAPLIRVFPDLIQPGATREETRDFIAESLREVASRAPDGVRVGLETHGDFARGSAAAEIIKIAGHAKLSIIWDMANSLAGGDTFAESACEVLPYLSHVHLRDARAVEGEQHWKPVLAGRGSVSFSSALKTLRAINYEGYVSFEWEKYWHPEIEEPEVALPDFAGAMRRALEGNTSKDESVASH